MKEEVLYHFLPRKTTTRIETLDILGSIFKDGLFLTYEHIPVKWKDKYGTKSSRQLSIEQYRFCLTAITNKEELINHSSVFGNIGIEFSVNIIVKLGGFPVFYIPTPKYDNASKEEYIGVSLLYRLGEIQEILEYIYSSKLITTNDIDLENVIGSIKLLGNICYPTQRKIDSSQNEINYYHQREWRVIYGLTTPSVKTQSIIYEGNQAYSVNRYKNQPIHKFVNRIVINNINEKDSIESVSKEDVFDLMKMHNVSLDVKYVSEL